MTVYTIAQQANAYLFLLTTNVFWNSDATCIELQHIRIYILIYIKLTQAVMYISFFRGINYKGTATTSEVHLEAEQKEPQIMHCMTCDDVYPFPCFHSLHDSSVRLASERVSDITA